MLQQLILNCRLCQEHGYIPVAHPIVSGRVTDRVMVIGQAPGHRSIEQDLPFSGPGGLILQKWLERAGFPPGYLHEQTYLSSLTRCDPGKNPRGSGDRKPSAPEILLCKTYLETELQLIAPRVVLLVGSMAIEAFLGPYAHNAALRSKVSRASLADAQTTSAMEISQKVVSGKIKLEKIIGTYQERAGMLFLPLPHPSGVSRWLNTPEHQILHQQALDLLAGWRKRYML